jgi:hypothetical protein
MEGDHEDVPAPEAGEMSEGMVSADRQLPNDGRSSPVQSYIPTLNSVERPEERPSDSKQKGKVPMVLQEQKGLESLMRSMLTSLQRIELLLEGQQKDSDPLREPVRKNNGDEENADDKTVVVSQQLLKVRTQS